MELKLGEKIRYRRKQLGLTLKDIAGEKVTPSQISAIEKGKCKPSSDLLAHISRSLNVDIEYFVLTEEERQRKNFEEIKGKCRRHLEKGEFDAVRSMLNNSNDIFNFLDELQKGHFYYLQGECFYRENKYSMAFDYFVKSLLYFLRTKDINAAVDTYIKIGNCLCNTQKPDMALGYYLNAYKYIDMKIEHELAATLLFNLSICYIKLKRFDASKEFLIKCVWYINEYNWPQKERFLTGIEMINGIISIETEKIHNSLELFENAFKKYKEKGDILGMGRARNNCALCFSYIGNNEKAIEYLSEAIDYKAACNDETLVETYINLANLFKQMNNIEKAIEVINKAEERVLEKDSAFGLTEIFIVKFGYYIEIEDYDRAEIFAFIALDHAQKTNDTRSEIRICLMLSEMYKKIGDNETSIEFMLKAKTLMG